jgi:perosamine synthetase
LDVEKYKNDDSEMLIAVNHNGVLAKIDEIRKVFNGFILEDCAHSCYTEGAGLKGDVAVWSFQAVKIMSTGDGGMITTNDKQLADRCREMTWFGIPSTWSRTQGKNIGYSWDYEIESLGYKCYMTDLIAALGLAQMKRLPELLEKRRWIQKTYNEKLDKRIERPVWSETCQYYVVKVDSKIRNKLIIFLAEKNIHTSVHFKPLHLHPLLKQDRDYPISDVEWKKMITLPCYYSMTDEELEYVIYWVNKFMEQNEIIHT